MERGTAGGAQFRTWTAVADVLSLSIELGSSIDLDPPGTQAMAGSMVDRRLAGLELVARLAEAGHWAARSRVVEDSSGTLRSVNLTLRRFAPPQAVVVRIWDVEFGTALFPKDGRYLVPLKAWVRKAEALEEGDTVTIRLTLDL